MPTNEEYEAEIKKQGWPELRQLWTAIKARDTGWWERGRAFEYLVLRMFHLDNAQVRWSYGVDLLGSAEVEQIDGSLRIGNLYCLVESKDEESNIGIAPIAKLRNQLLRRPASTIGFLFSSQGFTNPRSNWPISLSLKRSCFGQATRWRNR
jgi:hypothetical protein